MKPVLVPAVWTVLSVAVLTPVGGEDRTVTDRIYWQAHRGGGTHDAPDNTMAAFDYTWGLGGIPEADIRTTSDGVIICLHDSSLARTTNAPASLRKKNVKGLTFEQIRKWDAGVKLRDEFQGQKVPSLADVFKKMKRHPERQVYLDIKDVDLKQLGAMIDEYSVNKQVLIASPRQSDCQSLKKITKDLRTMIWIGGSAGDIRRKYQRVVKSEFAGVDQVQLHLNDKKDKSSFRYQLAPDFLRQALQECRDADVDLEVFPRKFDESSIHGLLDMGIRWYATDEPKRFRQTTLAWQRKSAAETQLFTVSVPPADLKVDAFYQKYTSVDGYPIIASGKVDAYALKEAAYLVRMMLAHRPDLRKAMVKNGSRLIIIAHSEFTTDIPEYSHMTPKDFWDARARGLGGNHDDPVCSCGEENLLAYKGDPYEKENILIHEFAHNIHLLGLVSVDPTFDERLKRCYDQAMKAGLWKGKYASVNKNEYWAEGVQSWFNNNRPPDHDHNHVDTRKELREYDPGLAELCHEVFGDTKLLYTKPTTRLKDHLAGYDPAKAPEFKWPKRLDRQRAEIKKKAQNRGKD